MNQNDFPSSHIIVGSCDKSLGLVSYGEGQYDLCCAIASGLPKNMTQEIALHYQLYWTTT